MKYKTKFEQWFNKQSVQLILDGCEISPFMQDQRLGEPGKILSKFDGKRSQFKDYDFMAYQEPTKEEKNKMNFQKSLLDNGSSGGVSVEEPIDEDLPF